MYTRLFYYFSVYFLFIFQTVVWPMRYVWNFNGMVYEADIDVDNVSIT